jgi:hypothetical protein
LGLLYLHFLQWNNNNNQSLFTMEQQQQPSTFYNGSGVYYFLERKKLDPGVGSGELDVIVNICLLVVGLICSVY